MDQSIGGSKVVVEVVERQGALGNAQLVDGELAGDHHGDLGDLDGEGVDIDAEELGGGNERHAPGFLLAA